MIYVGFSDVMISSIILCVISVGCKLPHNAAPVKHPKPYYTIGETILVSNFECDLSSTALPEHGMTCLEGGSWTETVTCKTVASTTNITALHDLMRIRS
jgi:hypothetical protein